MNHCVRWLTPVFGIAAALLSQGCSRETSANSNPPVAEVDPAPAADLYRPKRPAQFPLVKVESSRVPDQLLTNCVVAPDVLRTVRVTSLAAGRAADVRVRLGDRVRQGQVLMVLDSPELAGAIADYRKAQADEALARKALDRAQLLFAHGATAQKEVEQAEDAESKARVDVATAGERIRLLGGNLEQLSPVIEVKAPVSGTIVEQNTAGGEAVKSVDSSPSLFTIADLSRVWALCDVYENDLSHVRAGDGAEVRLNAYSDRTLRGRVGNVAQVLDPGTRSAKARLELDNSSGLLRPGMFATAVLVSRAARERLVVPATAVLRLHDRDWVFRAEGGGRFRRTEVKTGPSASAGRQEILAGGLRQGDQIVANALEFSSSAGQM